MAYTAKTNWALDNIVLPADMNRIETGIKEAHDGVAAGGKFATPMKLSITGGATGEVTFDGTQNVALNIGVSATGHTHSNVTTSANGMMLSADKSKLDGIASGATKTIIHNTLTGTSTTEALSAAQGKALKDLVDGKAPTVHAHSVAVKSTNNVGGSHGFMSAQDKEKLDGIQAGAGATVVVENILTSDSIANALSAAQGKALKTLVDGKASTTHSHNNATTSAAGYMSSTDKTKLNEIASGATNTVIVDNLTSSSTAQALSANQGKVLNNNFDYAVTLIENKASKDVATTTTNGLMASADKSKLNGIESGANYVPLSGAWGSSSTTTALSLSGAKDLYGSFESYTGHSFDVISGGWWINSTTYNESLTVVSTASRGRSVMYKSVQCPSSRSIGAGAYSTYDFSLGLSSSLYTIADIHVVTSESTYVITSVGSLSISSQVWNVGITMYNPYNSAVTARPIVGVTYVYN